MRRPLLLGTAWTASAAAAVGIGFLAVSLVDASASPGTVPAGATGTPSTGATATGTPPVPSAAPTATLPTGEYATAGGTVYADCSSGSPVVAGAPAAGWYADDSPDPGEVEFENGSQKVEVDVYCAGGVPYFVLDDSSARTPTSAPGGSSTTAPSMPSMPSAPSTSGGGHGSDDPPGDDHGGDRDDDRGGDGGGHGSDD
jgi:hypothetical protein